MILYMVKHLHILYDDVEDIKFLGVFSTKKEAEKAIQMLSKQSGFKDFPKIIDDNDDVIYYVSIAFCKWKHLKI